MIERGPDSKSQIENGLVKLNSHRKGTKYVNTRDILVTANFWSPPVRQDKIVPTGRCPVSAWYLHLI